MAKRKILILEEMLIKKYQTFNHYFRCPFLKDSFFSALGVGLILSTLKENSQEPKSAFEQLCNNLKPDIKYQKKILVIESLLNFLAENNSKEAIETVFSQCSNDEVARLTAVLKKITYDLIEDKKIKERILNDYLLDKESSQYVLNALCNKLNLRGFIQFFDDPESTDSPCDIFIKGKRNGKFELLVDLSDLFGYKVEQEIINKKSTIFRIMGKYPKMPVQEIEYRLRYGVDFPSASSSSSDSDN